MPTKQKSGLYRAKIKIGEKDGKPLYKYISAHTKKELEAERKRVIAILNGDHTSEVKLFGQYAQEWLPVRYAPHYSPQTIRTARSMLNKYILPAVGDKPIQTVSAMDLQAILNGMVSNGRAPGYCNHARNIMRHIFGDAYADRVIAHDPSTRLTIPPRTTRSTRRALTAEERAKVEQSIPTLAPMAALLIAIAYYTGMRVGEICALKWQDIDLDTRTIHVKHSIDLITAKLSDGKTKSAVRTVPIPPPLLTVLQQNRSLPSTYVLHQAQASTPIGSVVYPEWRSAIAQIGIDSTITPHFFRHNFITMCWEKHIDPAITMRIVGHSSYAITQDIYTHLTKTSETLAADQIAKLFEA